MALGVEVLFARPQREIASLLRSHLDTAQAIRIVSGFATVEGFSAIFPSIRGGLGKLRNFVVGAGTYRAFELLDELRDAGVPPAVLKIHLGHTRGTKEGATHSFYRYHPMLHSKVYLMDMPHGNSCVFIGSHNLTGFAMYGLNSEAAVLLKGPSGAPEIQAARDHVDECVRQAVQYDPAMKEAYTWWSVQFLEGLRDKANDIPREGEGDRTIVILSVQAGTGLPKNGEIVYFEIPEEIGQIESLRAEVHIFVFDKQPASPLAGLHDLGNAVKSYWCKTLGIEKERGGVELKADWQVVSATDPRLLPARQPFRPRVGRGMRQIRAKIYNDVRGSFEYLFPEPRKTWKPTFSKEERVELPPEEMAKVSALKLVPPEDKPWSLVRALVAEHPENPSKLQKAVRAASPESGRFILFSLRRRQKKTSRGA